MPTNWSAVLVHVLQLAAFLIGGLALKVVADAAINDKVEGGVWADAVEALVSGIKAGRTADGFVAAIEKCGAVLATHFPPGALRRDAPADKLVEL